MGRQYAYTRRRRRAGGPAWWLLLPLLLVAGGVTLGLRLPHGTGSLLVAGSEGCPAGERCAPGVLSSVACGTGGACDERPGSRALGGEVYPRQISGRSAIVLEEPCGARLYSLNADQRSAPASLTKIATALVTLDRADLSEMVDVQVDGAELAATTDSTIMGLVPGTLLSVRDLLYGLLLPSGNDAAIALAEHVAGSVDAFVGLMNAEAAQLGLAGTHFANPHGLDAPDLYTSAQDIAMLGRELLHRPELAAIVRTPVYQPAWDGPPLWNGNRLLQLYPGTIGVKIGYTDDASQTIVAAAERDGRSLIVSVLSSEDVYGDAITLFEWAFGNAPPACGPRTER